MQKFAQAIALVLAEGVERGITLDIPVDYKWLECEREYYNSAGFQELINSQEVFTMKDFIEATNLSDRIVGMIFAEINVNVLYRSAYLWGGPAWVDSEILSFGLGDSSSGVSINEHRNITNTPSRLAWADSVTSNRELLSLSSQSFTGSTEEPSSSFSFFKFFSILSLIGGSAYLLYLGASYFLMPLPPVESLLDPTIRSYLSSPVVPQVTPVVPEVIIPEPSSTIADYLPSYTTVIITTAVVVTLWFCGVPVPFVPL